MKNRRLDIRTKIKLAYIAVAAYCQEKGDQPFHMNQVMVTAESAGGEYRELHYDVFGYSKYLPDTHKTTWINGLYMAVPQSYQLPPEYVAGQDSILAANPHLCATDLM